MRKPAGKRRDKAPTAAQRHEPARAGLQLLKRALEKHRLGRLAEAEALYLAFLKREPRHVHGLLSYATLLRMLGRFADSLAQAERAVAAAPGDAGAQFGLGVALRQLRRDREAAEAYEKALAIDPAMSKAWVNLAVSTDKLDRQRSLEAQERALALDPDNPIALNMRLKYALLACDFDASEKTMRHLARIVGDDPEKIQEWRVLANTVYRTLMVPIPAGVERRLCERIDALHRRAVEELGPLAPPAPPNPAAPARRLRIGYLTPNLADHPVGHVTLELFRAHDRRRFEIHAFAPLGRRGGDQTYNRLHRRGVDFYHDVGEQAPREVAGRMRNLGIDILVDLDGYMETISTQIMAFRPAPVQIYWLGHAGGLGLSFVDYLIADRIVVPPGEEGAYREAILRLPECYHVASRGAIGETAPGRLDCGLPAEGFVFGAFNNPEKIDRSVFSAWMRILAGTPGSVLWLSAVPGLPAHAETLRRHAAAAGIDPSRLVFAERLPDKAAHFARHRHIGLFLDTLTLNASTTALDALWAGVPLLAVRGKRFASRISNTMLTQIGLADMIADDVEAYVARAIDLARHPAELAAVQSRLWANRERMPLFDVPRFARHLEAGYEAAWQRHCRGEAPTTIDVPARGARAAAMADPPPAIVQPAARPPLLIHLEGSQAREGWTIVAAAAGPSVDIVCDPFRLDRIAEHSADSIYACWLYQRLAFAGELPAALAAAARVLKPGGSLRLSVPDFQALSAMMTGAGASARDRLAIMTAAFGEGRDGPTTHRAGLTAEFMGLALKRAGFRSARRVASFGLFEDRSNAQLFGRAISLNIEAVT